MCYNLNMLNKQLTKNFKLSELACPCCWAFDMPEWVLEKIQAVRDEFGFNMTINSGYRCKDHNVKVGGSSTSRHLIGLAIDVKINQNQLRKKILEAAERHGVCGIGVAKTFIHLDWDTTRKSCWIY